MEMDAHGKYSWTLGAVGASLCLLCCSYTYNVRKRIVPKRAVSTRAVSKSKEAQAAHGAIVLSESGDKMLEHDDPEPPKGSPEDPELVARKMVANYRKSVAVSSIAMGGQILVIAYPM